MFARQRTPRGLFTLIKLVFIAGFAGVATLMGWTNKTDSVPAATPQSSSQNAEERMFDYGVGQARATLPAFWERFAHKAASDVSYSVLVRIHDGHDSEDVWLTDLEMKSGMVSGTIEEEPKYVKGRNKGDRLQVPLKEVEDWMQAYNGKLAGAYTIRAMMPVMEASEAAMWKKALLPMDKGWDKPMQPRYTAEQQKKFFAEAVAEAKKHLPEFWKRVDHPASDESDFAVGVALEGGKQVDVVWITVTEHKGDQVTGVSRDPACTTHKLGEKITAKVGQVFDWQYVKGSEQIGDFTAKTLLEHGLIG